MKFTVSPGAGKDGAVSQAVVLCQTSLVVLVQVGLAAWLLLAAMNKQTVNSDDAKSVVGFRKGREVACKQFMVAITFPFTRKLLDPSRWNNWRGLLPSRPRRNHRLTHRNGKRC